MKGLVAVPHLCSSEIGARPSLSSQMRMNKSILTQSWKVTMQNVEVKLLFIPIIFILLRIWSLLLAVIVVEANHQLPCAVVTVFLYIGVSLEATAFFMLSKTLEIESAFVHA